MKSYWMPDIFFVLVTVVMMGGVKLNSALPTTLLRFQKILAWVCVQTYIYADVIIHLRLINN